MRNMMFAAIVLIFNIGFVFGQTISDLDKKYGKPIYAYEVSDHIWMTPQYSASGDVCEMRLYPKRIGRANENFISAKRLPFEELIEVLNQLVPPNNRGPKTKAFGITATGGGAAWTTYAYEKVEFVFISSFRTESSSTQLKPYVFSKELKSSEQKAESNVPSHDDFLPSQVWSTEIVTVRLNGRNCVTQ